MRTVKALALVQGSVLLGVHAIFQNGEVVKLPVTPQNWEKRKMMEEFIKKLLKANHMAVNRYEIAGAYIYNIYYVDVENFTVDRRLS